MSSNEIDAQIQQKFKSKLAEKLADKIQDLMMNPQGDHGLHKKKPSVSVPRPRKPAGLLNN